MLSQYEKLTQQLLSMRQLFPPVAPDSPSLQSQPDLDTQEEPVETNLTEDQQLSSQSTESEPVETESVETKPVETKLIDSVTLHFPFPRETRVHNPDSIPYTAPPLISQTTKPTPTTEIEAPARVHSATS